MKANNTNRQQDINQQPLRGQFPERMNPAEAALYMRRSYATLARWRRHGNGPRFVKTSNSSRAGVIYLRRDLDAWLEAQSRTSTSDQGDK